MEDEKKSLKNELPTTSVRQKKKSKWKVVILCVVLLATVLFVGWRWLSSEELEVTFYHLYSAKVTSGENIRVAVLSDLHNSEFGPGNSELLEKLSNLEPDLIAVAGDMVNGDEPDRLDITLNLCEEMVKIAPVYYCPGNHESDLMYAKSIPFDEMLQEKGVHVMVNWSEETIIKRTPILVGCLVADPGNYDTYGADFIEEYEQSADFKLLLSHFTNLYYEKTADADFDLAVSGHFHGGQFRLPFIGGVYHGDTGLFPKYSDGMFTLSHGTLFVSRGMGGHNSLPRINNRPELAIIDINGRP